jgi:hypothetical protein
MLYFALIVNVTHETVTVWVFSTFEFGEGLIAMECFGW